MKTTITDIANKAGISKAYLSELLNGKKKNPSTDVVMRLEKASKKLGFGFTASDWMFNPSRIKCELMAQKAA